MIRQEIDTPPSSEGRVALLPDASYGWMDEMVKEILRDLLPLVLSMFLGINLCALALALIVMDMPAITILTLTSMGFAGSAWIFR
jgi:hypothetical protein